MSVVGTVPTAVSQDADRHHLDYLSRRASLIAALACSAFVITSCASSGPQPSTPPAAELPSPSATEQPSGSPPEIVLCPSRELGSCLGPIAAGSYMTSEFVVPFTYTVPDGWPNYEDLPGNFLLLPPSGDLPGVNNDVSEFVGLYDGVAPASANCEEVPEPGISVTPAAMAAWYASHPGLAVSEPQAVTIGGLDGLVIDLNLADDHTGSCPYAHAGEALVPLLIGVGPAGLHHVINASFTTRLYLLTSPFGETIAIEVVDHADGLTMEELAAVVETIELGL